MLLRILVATESPREAPRLAQLVASEDVLVTCLPAGGVLWEELRAREVDLVIVEDRLLDHPLAASLTLIRNLPGAPEVVVFVRDSSPELRAQAQAAGAFAVIDRAVEKAELVLALESVIGRRTEAARRRLMAERADERSSLSDFSSSSPAMREFLAFVRKVVQTDSSLLVLGETGVGKEYLSRAIHAESPRSEGPFIPVNCSALSESLLESELFGHVEGAFTGASRSRRGYFELAHRGTLFLDEIGELSSQLQVKLLRVLQEKTIQPVGGEEEIEVDVRLVTATNRDLREEMEAERFRADLFYRLSVVTLEVPPLRSRREDIPRLIESHVEDFRISMKRTAETVSDEAMEQLIDYAWPGNVRELSNVIERAVLLCEGTEITSRDLPVEIRGESIELVTTVGEAVQDALGRDDELSTQPFRAQRREVLRNFERAYLTALLKRCNGRIQDAARTAGINTRSLYEKMRRLGIKKEYFKVRKR